MRGFLSNKGVLNSRLFLLTRNSFVVPDDAEVIEDDFETPLDFEDLSNFFKTFVLSIGFVFAE